MNKTQERITENFTIGHATQTVEHLLETTTREVEKAEKGDQREDYDKLVKVQLALVELLTKAKNVKYLIDHIDE